MPHINAALPIDRAMNCAIFASLWLSHQKDEKAGLRKASDATPRHQQNEPMARMSKVTARIVDFFI